MSVDFENFKIHVRSALPPGGISLDERRMLAALGLAGEAGEVADQIKKNRYHGRLPDHEHDEKMLLELGDLLWYFALMCDVYGLTLEEVMQTNIEKLRQRGALRKG